MIETFNPHFVYTFRCFDRHNNLCWEWTEKNLIPTAGRDYIVAAALSGGSQFSTWYISLYSGADRKSTRLNSSHIQKSRMPSSA